MPNRKIYPGQVDEGSLLVHVMMKSGRGHRVLLQSDKHYVMYWGTGCSSIEGVTAESKLESIYKLRSLTDVKGIVLNPAEVESAEALEETPKIRRYNKIETEATFWNRATVTYEWIDDE